MTAAPRLSALAALLTAGLLVLGACGTSDPSQDAAAGTGSEDGDPGAAARPYEVCADDPRADEQTEVVVNRGDMDCADVTALLDDYLALAQSGRFGNAGIVPDLRGFSCAAPTARSAALQGIGIRCAQPDVEILVRPSAPVIPGVQQEVSRFVPEGSITNGRSFFTLPSGQAACAIYPDHTPPNAECYGAMPAGLPEVPGLMGHVGEPTSVRVDDYGQARLTITGTAPYPLDGVPFTTLEVGQTLASAGFACTVTAPDAVTCTNTGGNGFDYSPREVLLG